MKKVFRILLNKYLLTGLLFFAWMFYFDQNDWMSQQQRKKELQAEKDNIAYLQKEIDGMEKENIAIRTDPGTLERFARENFHMKRDNEDLYLIDKK